MEYNRVNRKVNKNLVRATIGTAVGLGAGLIATMIAKRMRNRLPEELTAVAPFDAEAYLGEWYEIARLDFRWEKNLSDTMAEYTLNEDGTINVVNSGFNYMKDQWKEATGKARFKGSEDVAELEVSFFGPFYSDYTIVALEGDYEYALVVGKSTKYCWILSRTPHLPEDVRSRFITKAIDLGINVNDLVWVEHHDEV